MSPSSHKIESSWIPHFVGRARSDFAYMPSFPYIYTYLHVYMQCPLPSPFHAIQFCNFKQIEGPLITHFTGRAGRDFANAIISLHTHKCKYMQCPLSFMQLHAAFRVWPCLTLRRWPWTELVSILTGGRDTTNFYVPLPVCLESNEWHRKPPCPEWCELTCLCWTWRPHHPQDAWACWMQLSSALLFSAGQKRQPNLESFINGTPNLEYAMLVPSK